MSRRRDAMGFTQAENDVAEVMIWLRSNHGREVSYADIAAGAGITNGHRLRRAVRVVRVIAANPRRPPGKVHALHRPCPAQGLSHPLHAPHSIARKEFATMAKATDECITKVAGIDTVGSQVVRHENTGLLTEMIADLEARLTEPTAG
ncbi:hypothetical protein [Nonomuraea basaltis]|uniref:hypothetical protein n=1 Tax=Nonomuraea basaltis TaxID=2495887 RepID=UPI00110C3FA1|nr:hypothetical protein [Nonomuraea basaltis]TMR94845.1 hypothetical protein EJK15_31505 [Nonomuraea basaltis]